MRTLFLLLCLFSFSGQAQHIDSIKIGNGGGFTGTSTVYLIHKSKVSKSKGISSSEILHTLSSLSCSQSHQIKKEAKAIWSEVLPFENPSNTYKWVEIYSKGKTKKYVWGDPSAPPPGILLDYYSHFLDIVKTLSFN